jgi:hypothetical protein
MKNKKHTATDKPLSLRWYLSVVGTLLVVFFLARQGYTTKLQENETPTMGMTPGAIQLFEDSPTVIPLDRGDVPVGVLRLNGETYTIWTVKTE